MIPAPSWAKWGIAKIRSRRWPLVAPALLFAAGIGAGDQLPMSVGVLTLAMAVLIAAVRWPVRPVWWGGIFLTGIALQMILRMATPAPPVEPRLIQVTGQVREQPQPYGATGERFRVICQTADRRMLVLWRGKTPPDYGDQIEVRGVLRAIPPPRNPGEFDYADWMKRRGITSELDPAAPEECRVIATNGGNPVIRAAVVARRWILRTIVQGLDPADPATALIQAMTLGDVTNVPSPVREAFQLSGTLHVFSVSGLHVAMVALLVGQMVRLVRLPRTVQGLVVIAVVFAYALVTGWSPPSVRAAIMTACFILAMMAGRPASSFNILAGAALVILLFNPQELFNVGFQLSFAVVATILALSRILQLWLERRMVPDPWLPRPLYSRWQEGQWLAAHHVGSLLSVSLVATLGSLLLTSFHFHFVSVVSPWINLLVVPLSFLILSLAMLSILSGLVSAWLAGIFAHSNWLAAALTLFLVERSAELPGAYAYVGLPLPPAIRAKVTVFDAGRGGAVVIQTAEQTVLLDTGPAFFFDRTVLPELRRRGIGRVQALILSHGDAQHLGGAKLALEKLRPEWLGVPAARMRSPILGEVTELAGSRLRRLGPGEAVSLGSGVTLRVRGPLASDERQRADEAGLVLRLEAGEWSALFTFDAGYQAEERLLNAVGADLRSTIWIKGQHGSGKSGRDSFLEIVSPRAVIATHGEFPDTERFPREWGASLEERGIRVFNQGETGAVEIEFRTDRVTMRPFLHGEPLEIRQ